MESPSPTKIPFGNRGGCSPEEAGLKHSWKVDRKWYDEGVSRAFVFRLEWGGEGRAREGSLGFFYIFIFLSDELRMGMGRYYD